MPADAPLEPLLMSVLPEVDPLLAPVLAVPLLLIPEPDLAREPIPLAEPELLPGVTAPSCVAAEPGTGRPALSVAPGFGCCAYAPVAADMQTAINPNVSFVIIYPSSESETALEQHCVDSGSPK